MWVKDANLVSTQSLFTRLAIYRTFKNIHPCIVVCLRITIIVVFYHLRI
jgi:hypothetical protein